MRISQGGLKTWNECPLRYRFAKIDRLPAEQSCALTFGSVLHDVVLHLETTRDLDAALERFTRLWNDPTELDPDLEIDYFLPGRTWIKYKRDGQRILRDWWSVQEWNNDTVLAREHHFIVPIGDGHELEGYVDKLSLHYDARRNTQTLLIPDYKTSRTMPTAAYLEHDLQFTAYAYATTRPEFWQGIPDGEAWYDKVKDLPRRGEWIALQGPKRLDAGERTQMHYNRLEYAVNAIADSVAWRIFPPTISGDSCKYCPYRLSCGITKGPR